LPDGEFFRAESNPHAHQERKSPKTEKAQKKMEGGNSRRRLISTILSTQHNNPDGLHTSAFFIFVKGEKKRKEKVWRDWWFIYLGEEEIGIELYIRS
jgi:hypothetical protein